MLSLGRYLSTVMQYWITVKLKAKKQLESIYVEAGRIITGATKLCSIEKLFID